MVFKNGVKNIQAAAYNGVHTVSERMLLQCFSQLIHFYIILSIHRDLRKKSSSQLFLGIFSANCSYNFFNKCISSEYAVLWNIFVKLFSPSFVISCLQLEKVCEVFCEDIQLFLLSHIFLKIGQPGEQECTFLATGNKLFLGILIRM